MSHERTPDQTPAPQAEPMTLLIADDNPVVRAGLCALLGAREDIHILAEATDGAEALYLTRLHRPDVVLLDVRMPRTDGLAALPQLAAISSVLMLTYSRDGDIVQRALRLGANGYLVHGEFTVEELVTAVRDTKAGRANFAGTAAQVLLRHIRQRELPQGASQEQRYVSQSERRAGNHKSYGLSSREEEIMDLIATGMSNREIASTCFISEKTVKNHINSIFAKLDSANRSEAISRWLGTARTQTPGRDHG
ncbi:response regulator [Streptomyces sp. NPDC006879]|uniref:response regulator n=1 Tax=Streptomyces sp. NPDC006879 TaxID=3364767 RepID=UPI0036AA61A8